MPAIAAADVTVTITDRWIAGGKVNVVGTLAFGDGSKTYSTAGIPLPVIGKFGFGRRIQVLSIFAVNELTSDYMVRYGPANHTLLLYEEEGVAAGGPLLEADTSEAPAARTYSFHAIGD